MFKKIATLVIMFLYLYTLTFNIFMTEVLRVPSPLLFGLPLIFLFPNVKDLKFHYQKEVFIFFLAAIALYLFAVEDVKTFLAVMIICTTCAAYFNYFVGTNLVRLKQSIWIFYALLAISCIIMLLNHMNDGLITGLRSQLIGERVKQAPSGISPSIFSFGYQLAAFATFIVVTSGSQKKHILIQVIAFLAGLILIFYGMNRSVLVVFFFCIGIFWLSYYRFKTVLLFSALIGLSIILKSSVEDFSIGKRQQNILAKNEANAGENRSSLMIENLKIIADNPFGLAFSDVSWESLAMRNPAFRMGEKNVVTSHNAYLMFITYLGILLGGLLIIFLFNKIILIFFSVLKHSRDPNYALLTSLCFSFIAVSLNSFFHNEWLLAASGPTLFLYFSVIHLSRVQNKEPEAKSSLRS